MVVCLGVDGQVQTILLSTDGPPVHQGRPLHPHVTALPQIRVEINLEYFHVIFSALPVV